MANKKGSKRTIMADGTVKGSGRTTGSFSFVLLSLEQINAKFADKNTPIKVGRKWAQECGFANLVSSKVADLNAQVQGNTPETKVEVAEVDLDKI